MELLDEKIRRHVVPFWYNIPQRDGQTDRQTDRIMVTQSRYARRRAIKKRRTNAEPSADQ